ncbi:MAG: hypothetical protein AB8G86_06165 [Saprospiraceae bacterium]
MDFGNVRTETYAKPLATIDSISAAGGGCTGFGYRIGVTVTTNCTYPVTGASWTIPFL